MRRLLLGSVGLVAIALGTSAAFAADKRVPAYTPPPPPVPVYTWSGCYVGASAGTSTGRSEHTAVDGSTFSNTTLAPIAAGTPITDKFNLSGFIGGFQGGCNYQTGVWVFGMEMDGSATNKSGQGFETPLTSLRAAQAGWISETQERWLVTARGRLGMTWWDRSMVYVTGGGAWAKIDVSEWVPANPIATGHQESNWRGGWTVGGGVEYALGYGWSVKGEYLYADFGTYRTFVLPPFNTNNVSPRDVKLNDHIWRAGMNYRFTP
jgi:outer membrane immunogenic protein